MSFEDIPDDLVPLTAHFKHLLTLATISQPILLFLDSVDQLTGIQGNKLSWLPTRLPSNCKVLTKIHLLSSCIQLSNYKFILINCR